MEVHLTPEQEAQFSRLATNIGRGRDELVQEALTQYLSHEAQFIEAVQKGFASLDRGEYVEHEEVGERIERRLQS
jgi:predicted transcriptional regulator